MTNPYVFTDEDKAPKGMTLRDYFVILVLGEIIPQFEDHTPESVVALAYEVADAMLKIREQS